MGLIFDVEIKPGGSLRAKCYREQIYTQAVDLEELHDNIDAEIDKAFDGREKPKPSEIHLLLSKD